MKRIVYVLYVAGIFGLFLFYIYICFAIHNEVFQEREDLGYEMITEYEKHQVGEERLPEGVKEIYQFKLKELPDREQCLMFYSLHQEVDVYVGERLVYSLHAGKANFFGKTPGRCFNAIPFLKEDSGSQIRIELTPVYSSSVGVVPEFYFGSELKIWMGILLRNFVPFLLSMIAVLAGLAFLLFTVYNYKNTEVDKSLMMMGMFSIHIGMWKITDMEAFSLVVSDHGAVDYLPFLSLLLVIIPYVLFVKELFSKKEHVVWYVLCFVCFAVTLLSIGLQAAGIADLRQTLWMTHLDMAAMVIVVLGMLFIEWRIAGWNSRLKLMAACLGLCLVGLVSDLVLYYVSKGSAMMFFGMFGFLTYIIILGVMSIRRTKKLMKIGMKAKRYERMAYHDQLTGLFNRTAYADHTGAKSFSPENCIAVMFDLNDLKKCNDTQGHEQGDRYIMCGTQIIKESFGDIGKCYRMGGDEFCVLLENVSLEECGQRVKRLKELVEEHNKAYPDEFPVQIACGYEIYDEKTDFDFGDTLRRADKMMYHEKFIMKSGRASA
jgi:diguanylate cyclase (GGDEF) domain